MRRGLGKRILSLALAAELLCTPLAMARAEDPTRVREETPLGEEIRPVWTPADKLPVSGTDTPVADITQDDPIADASPVEDAPVEDTSTIDNTVEEDAGSTAGEVETLQSPTPVSGGGSIFALPGIEDATLSAIDLSAIAQDNSKGLHHLGLSFGLPYNGSSKSITYYGGYLRQESPLSEGYLNTWGYSGGNSVNRVGQKTISLGKDGYLYFCLPDMGRVPDLELEGLYLYSGAEDLDGYNYASWVNDETVLRGWSYDEAHPENYKKLALETVAVSGDANVATIMTNLRLKAPAVGDYTLVRFPVAQVEEDLNFVYHVPADPTEGTAAQWSIPIVGRWIPSDDSTLALFALDIGDSVAGTMETVTDLYTKPFRQATGADHLTAGTWSATYQSQTATDLENYTSSETTRTATVFTPDNAAGADGVRHYYLRVEEEQDNLTLRFLTQEPNYRYHITENGGGVEPVTVTVAFSDRTAGTVNPAVDLQAGWDGDGQSFFPPSLRYGTVRNAQNSTTLPARGQWTVANIPLQKVSDAADPDTDPFNTITVTVTSPDGSRSSTYVFHIERLMTPQITLGYGNTPAGMVMRDNSTRWANSQVDWGSNAADVDPGEDLAAYNKASAINYFRSNHTFRDMPIQPDGSRNQGGAIYKGTYSPLAWQGLSGNPDLDQSAIVAYQDAAFDDPGVSFVDSEGHKVIFGQGATSEYRNCVTRTLELRYATALTVDSYAEEGVRCWYNVKADGTPYLEFDETKATQTMSRADGSDSVDLRGLIVLPGVYTAVYTFVDPVSNDELVARRTVVILPTPGDVDMDGAVTAADAVALDANTIWNTGTTGVYPLLRNRVYNIDVGGENNRATLNAKTIREGFQPILGATDALGYSDYMYLPLSFTGGEGYHVRKTWDEVRALNGSAQAKLRLEFLGVEQGTWNRVNGETYTNNISGPWASPDTHGQETGVSIVSGNPTSGSGDVFWMGIYVEDAGAMAGQSIRDLSVSLVYDSEYVRPAMVHAVGQGLAYGDETARWQITTLLRYNLLDGAQGHTIFAGRTGSDYTYENSAMDRPYATHYSKVEGDLELAYTDSYGHFNASKLKEVVFSLQGRSNNLATMKEGYLLVLPFQLIRHPDERMVGSSSSAQLIELAAGMRDFSIVLDGTTAYNQGVFSLFSAQPRTVAGTTYAFSAQEDIYGNTTQNIRETLTYNGSDGLVPIGRDNTQRTDLTATTAAYYDEYAEFRQQAFYQGHITAGALPLGMTLDNSAVMRISGTPTQVGVYDFAIDGQPYRITVSPKEIEYRAVAVSTYYGEHEFRGYSVDRSTGQRDFTFEYDRADLSSRDQAAARDIFPGWSANEWGSAEELKAILTRAEEIAAGVEYVPPVFYAQDENLRPVNYKSNVGKYDIEPENLADIATTNYTLTYAKTGDSGSLTIEARPVWISYLSIPQDRSGSSIYNDQAGTNQALSIQEQEGEELIVLAFDDGATGPEGDRQLNGRPLTGSARVDGDLLSLRFGADYVQNQADIAYVEQQGDQAIYRFLLEENEELRLLEVTQLGTSFTGVGDSAGNYSLRGRVADPTQPDRIEGTVIRRGVEAIRFANYPSILQANEDGTPRVQTYYGDKIIDPTSLHVVVTRGAGDGATNVGEYEYNNPSLRPMEIHYNWVSPADRALGLANPNTVVGTGWDPTLPQDEQDLRPYNGDDPLTPDMDGYYLCAVVRKYEANQADGEEIHYIKVYSDHPVRVSKRTITLTVQPSTRYYGEPNGDLNYTYNYQNLIAEEVNALRAWVQERSGDNGAVPTGSKEEMEAFFQEVLDPQGFQAPVLEVAKTYALPLSADGRAIVSETDRVDETTAVGGGEFYIILQGAVSSHYNFIYVRPKVVDNILTNQTEMSSVFGFAKMTMMKRPIVVSDIYSTDPDDPKANFETIYADTKNLFLQNQTAPLERVGFTLPENDGRATYFYRSGGSGDRVTLSLTYHEPTGPAVVNDDDVTIRYSVRFMCDPGHAVWMGFDNNYYEVAPISAAGGTVQKDVVVADMELLGDAAVNYELVYRTAEQAAQRAPSNVTRRTYPNPNHSGDNTGYLIHGTGAVTLRKITAMTLESVGQVTYTYGDNYAPYASNEVDRTPMKLVLNYETTEDERHNNGDYESNIRSESLEFQLRQGVSNFTQRGLTIYYLKPGQTTQQASDLGQILEHTTPMVPDEHNGARIFVTGKRRTEDPIIVSEISSSVLQVDKRLLTLTVRDAHRFYGETLHVNDGDVITDTYIGTTAFTYSFPTAQLAQRDREELAQLKGVAVSALPSVSTEADLKLLGVGGLTTPTYTADPGVDAPVNKDNWGEYPIGITVRDMAGYKVTGVPGTLYVYPRPVRVDDVRTSEEDPVYTIYNQSSSKQFTTQLDTEKVVLSRTNRSVSTTGQEIDQRVSTRYCSDNILRSMPLSGTALVGADSLAFTVHLYFYEENGSTWDLAAGVADYAKPQVNITFREVRPGDSSKNYTVSNVSLLSGATFERDGFWGAVKLRTIDEIFITGRPRTQYTYGETLDLSGLQVTIRYKALQGAGEINKVNYLGPDSFKQVGLYVNYWYPEDQVPGGRKPNATQDGEKDATTTTDQEDELRKSLPYTYRRADTGDHVTIAPTHDTQQYIGAASTGPQTRPFAANGKYLIVSAFQEGDKQTAATPKILGAEIDNTSVGTAFERENAPIPIVVTPLQLHYDLSAADKTYDGTTQAAGTLTLENVFDATVQVKIEESQGYITGSSERVRDVVYVPMGAAYEGHGTNYADRGYDGYRSALQNGVVSFATGSYQPNGEAPLLDNGTLNWADGYEWGKGLTFTFANPNVHYLETGESTPRAIGTQAMADYWRTSQAANDVKDQWDHYGEICAMPVEVTGMVLAGPDAANYTWATDGTAQNETEVTMTTRGVKEHDQASAPYATIHKANRATIQSMAGRDMVLPYLQMDEHTNVVRLFYAQDIAAMADNNNAAGADEFRDELHFEYALYYEDEEGLMTQWAGPQGDRGYQDTVFFGGELLQPEIDPDYVPDYDHLKTRDEVKDDFIRKGQRYRWAEEDTGVSELGYREDAGVVRDLAAYPGGASNAELYYAWYYDLFTWGGEGTARTALPRDTVFYPLVRLSETHNYNPSGNLSGDANLTAQALDAAQKTRSKLIGAEGEEDLFADAVAASADVFSAAQSMKEAALALSTQRVADDAALAAEGKLPEEGRPLMGSAPAVKTFLQRLDLISGGWVRNNVEGDSEEYLVQTLEDVWFTDTLSYPETENMDAVVYNSPRRYYNYYWDVDQSALIKFGDAAMAIDFDTVMTAEIRQRQNDGSSTDLIYTYDPAATGHTAQIYVQITDNSGGRTIRSLQIVPEMIYARLGDEPVQLTVLTNPPLASGRRYTWETSDPSVVTVNPYGVLTFRGEGSAVITVTSANGRVATASVVVSSVFPVTHTPGLFNFQYTGLWAQLDDDYAFRPRMGMTRGELAILLDLFLDPAGQWQATQELAYVDVTGREKYYDALKRLTGAGVITGIPGHAFAGDQLATRAEFAAMLSRMLQLNVVDTAGMTHAFADTDETDTWAYAYIDALAKAGVVRGVGGGDFAPNRVITREETAAIIARLLTAQLDMERADLLRPSDMTPENWSYPAVLRAINTIAFPD